MIVVESITLREIELPLLRPFRSAGGELQLRRIVLLTLTGADGMRAWSECVAQSEPSYSPETVDGAWVAISEWLAPRIVRGDPIIREARDAYAVLSAGVRGHRMAIAAVEMGIWALSAARHGLSLARLLAGTDTSEGPVRGEGRGTSAAAAANRANGTPPREWVEAGTAIGMSDSHDAIARHAHQARERGYRRIRLKIAPGHDADWIRAVREVVGSELPLVGDANGSYDPQDAAHLAALEGLGSLGLDMLEQPFAPQEGGLTAHAALSDRVAIPVSLDESITSHRDARDAIDLHAMAAINLKAGRVGGFQQAISIHDDCLARGIPIWCGGMHETGIGRACNVALASLPGFTIPGDLGPSDSYWARDIVRPAWTMDANGRVRVPLDVPGLGVEVDEGFVDSLTVREKVVRA